MLSKHLRRRSSTRALSRRTCLPHKQRRAFFLDLYSGHCIGVEDWFWFAIGWVGFHNGNEMNGEKIQLDGRMKIETRFPSHFSKLFQHKQCDMFVNVDLGAL